MNNRHLIKSVTPGSIAEEMEIEAGDYLLEVNGTTIVDIFDYQLLCMDEFIDVVIEKSNGEQWELEIEKDENEELGLEFENGLMDEYRSCCNKCMFCFIDWYQRNCIPAPGRSAGIPRVLDRDKNRRDGHEA